MNGFYINLRKRTDRKKHFEMLKLKYPFFHNIQRIEATEHENGSIGCGKSHIRALHKCLELGNDDVFIICEDDLTITHDQNFKKMTEELDVNKKWDVIVFTPRGDMPPYIFTGSNFVRICNNQTTSGYIVKRHVIPTLIRVFELAVLGLEQKGPPGIYSIDQYWKRMQQAHIFCFFKHLYAGQLVGYSDIEKRIVDYNPRFLSHRSL